MKLPTFHNSPKYKSLFKEMNTQYSKNDLNIWKSIDDSVLAEILRTGEVLIENEELIDYLEDNGFFRINSKTVLVYIKNQYLKYWSDEDGESKYRYHIYNCTTLRESILKGRKARYVFRDPVFKKGKGDDIFEINLTELGSSETVKTVNEKLRVCKNCLKETNFLDYEDKLRSEQKKLWDSFDYKSFFEVHEIQRLAMINFQSYRDTLKNEYPKNFSEISKKYRDSKKWTCEECNEYLGDDSNKKYLHTHHIDHQKSNNSFFNLKALCIECHSKKPYHEILKKNQDYINYIRKKSLKKRF